MKPLSFGKAAAPVIALLLCFSITACSGRTNASGQTSATDAFSSAQSLSGSTSENAEPFTLPGTKQETEPVTEPTTEQTAETIPVTEKATDPVTEPVTAPVTVPVTQPPKPIETNPPETDPPVPAIKNPVLEFTAVKTGTTAIKYVYYPVAGVTVTAGDTLEYDVWLKTPTSALGAVDAQIGTNLEMRDAHGTSVTDTEGISVHPARIDISSFAAGQWYHRVIPIGNAYATGSLSNLILATEALGASTTVTCYYKNIVLKSSAGKVKYTLSLSDLTVHNNQTHVKNNQCTLKITEDPGPDKVYIRSTTPAEQILAGIFNGSVKEVQAGQYTNIGGSFWMHMGDFVRVKGDLYCYYISYATRSGRGGVGLAISKDDGVTWKDYGCVIQPGDAWDYALAAFAGAWYEEATNTMYVTYESEPEGGNANIALAISTDGGFTFVKKGVILYHNTAWKWQNYNIGTPDLYKSGNTWYLTFHGFGSAKRDCQIGVAYGTDLYNLTMVDHPIIETSTSGPDCGTCGRRDVIYVDGWYYMCYEISTDGGAGGEPYWEFKYSEWTHSFARSRNMIDWETAPALLCAPEKGYNHDGPNWLILGNDVYVMYHTPGNTTSAMKLILK